MNRNLLDGQLILGCIFFFALFVGFLIFVRLNNGIALGDRSSHKPGFHPLQLSVCTIVMLLLFAPCLQLHVNMASFAVLVALEAILHHRSMPIHPYHLDPASNHITSRLVRGLNSKWRYLLVPFSAYAKLVVFETLWKSTEPSIAILFILCTIVVTVPSSLVEPRYYIIPCVMFAKLIDWNGRGFLAVSLCYLLADLFLLGLVLGPARGYAPMMW